MVSFRQGEFRHRGIELQLQALEENGVVDVPFRSRPAEDAVTQDKFDALRFTLDAPVKSVKRLEKLHGHASRPLDSRPLVALNLPLFEEHPSRWIVSYSFRRAFSGFCRLVPHLCDDCIVERVVPSDFQPFRSFRRRWRRESQCWPLHPKNKTRVIRGLVSAVLVCSSG